MAHNVQSVTLAMTLPISCHICLGKVRQPVICANYHVFCSVCIELWLKNNSQCPACRVPITPENPCKNIIGGTSEDEGTLTHSGRKHLRKTRLELLQKEYEEEIESLVKETEELKRRNLRLEERLSEGTHPASVSCNCRNKEAEDTRGISHSLLEEWSRKLEMVTAANKKVVEDNEKLKEESRKLRNESIECVRENLRLKNEVELRSPQKFGRFTVAALQAKVDQYEREMSRLKKALERSDQYIEELEAQVEQLKKRPPEDIQKEKSVCVHETDAKNTYTCQKLNATKQLLSHSFEESSSACLISNGQASRLNKQQSLCETVDSSELKSKSSKYSSTLVNGSEQMSIDSKSQSEGGELAPGFGSPTSSLPFSSLRLNTPDGKANGPSHVKKPLTYLRKLVFDDLPKKKELCNSNSSMSESCLNTGEGLAYFGEPKPSFLNFCQISCESGDSKLLVQRDFGLQSGKQKHNAADQRECHPSLKQSRASAESSMDNDGHDNMVEPLCNGSQCHGNSTTVSELKLNLHRESTFKVGRSSGNNTSSHQGGEPYASLSNASCSSSVFRDGENSQHSMHLPDFQDQNFQGHLPHTDTLSCTASLQSKEEVHFHSVSVEAEGAGQASQSTWLSHCNIQNYSNSPPAKRKMLNQSSDSPSKSLKP
ncbi:ORC ubiquitin ligase 1 isoform X2 [Dendropsophus ebraccatus]|uniref:ORC ubiquitin ligase 1 isoform X2 n=1 Tax=Dendropsophus ebraccatus TaxID=150705 RepID=UPI0038315381